MAGSQPAGSGFSPHIQEQLQQAAMSIPNPQTGRGRGQNRRARGNFYPNNQPYSQPHGGHYSYGQPPPRQPHPSWGAQQLMVNPTDNNSFPPLGASRPVAAPMAAQQVQNVPVQQPIIQTQYSQPVVPNQPPTTLSNSSYESRRGTYNRGRAGPSRGRGNYYNPNNQQGHGLGPVQTQSADDFRRPPPTQRNLFTGTQPQFNNLEDQRAFRKKIMDQSDFLNHLANQALKNQLTPEEQQKKEHFRKVLESIAQDAITTLKTEEMKFDPKHVQLKLYGSLGSGFGVAGSDMDLLLAFPQNEGSLGDIEIASRRLLEKALLDAGIGARLLENTRVPILRVCEKPTPELLENLREYRLRWEQNPQENAPPPVDEGFGPLPILSEVQDATAMAALANLDLEAHNVPLPASPQPEHAKLEFTSNCGIQCDINFSNYVALHNTRLLRTYGMCDPRVRQVGVFVKLWAKARDINTPYRGTLSSYGYILMVLHYLMHVVSPPVLPNLQEIAKQKDSWNTQSEADLFEGFDVRFVQNMDEVQAIFRDMPRNHESVGSLLRGFFWYFADPKGFHWNYDVISIRSRNGRMTKRSKGWTEAKWSAENQNVRLRYLLAIEDPFEVEHNIARTVGHSGIVAIRDEFRKAWATIENINFNQVDGLWFFLTQEGNTVRGDDMMSIMKSRGDLLRKDQDYHRQKARQMRQEVEAKEKALREAAAQETESQEEIELNGMSEIQSQSVAQGLSSSPSAPALINIGGLQVKHNQQEAWDSSFVQNQSEEILHETQSATINTIDWSKPFTDTEVTLNVEWVNDVGDGESRSVSDVWLQQPTIADEQVDKVENELKDAVPRDPVPTNQDDEDKLQVVIPWSTRSKAGRWLLWRDKQILSGKWTENRSKNTGNQWQRLDKKFPYEPNMSITDLAHKNKLLVTQYLNCLSPQASSEFSESSIEKASSNHDKPVLVDADTNRKQFHWQEDASKTNQLSTFRKSGYPSNKSAITSNASTVSTDSRTRGPRYRNTQRRTRAVVYDDGSERSQVDKAVAQPAQQTSPTVEMHEVSATYENIEENPPRSALSPVAGQDHDQLPIGPNENSNENRQPWQSLAPLPKKNVNDDNKRALLKLFRDDLKLIPKPGKDSDVISPPSETSFQFDPRQLADLEVIREGGNGCVRSQIEREE